VLTRKPKLEAGAPLAGRRLLRIGDRWEFFDGETCDTAGMPAAFDRRMIKR
jgi:hypothetical protein